MNQLVHVRTAQFKAKGVGDGVALWQRFLELVSGLRVVVLGTLKHDFPGGGISGLVMLAESHAAIHSWPETGEIWCEIAACGSPHTADEFIERLLHWRED
jgi:S-adenosylmethionine/arginine decarboxylase-like enzyme